MSGSLQKHSSRGCENFYLKKTLCRNPKSERKIVGLGGGFLSDLTKTPVFRTDYLRKTQNPLTFFSPPRLSGIGFPETSSIVTTWNEVITKYDSIEMSQGPSSIQLSIKENQMEGDKGPDSQPCVKRSVKKAAIVFETDLRKGRQ